MPHYEPMDWYRLPRYYDIIYDTDTADEADFLEALLRRYVGRQRGAVLEPACGTGRLVAELARRGHAVSGFDLSEPMLAYARRRLRRRKAQADLKRARLEHFGYRRRFHLAHCLFSTFKYLQSEADVRAHLHCVAEALHPGGVYALGLHLSDYDDTQRTRERWTAQRGGTHVTCNVQEWPADRRSRRQALRTRLVVRERDRIRRYETHWQFRTYSVAQLRRLLRATPALAHVDTFDFRHQIDAPVTLDDGDPDKVLILRRV
ncbi:MAG: class I SAM-dependent methyltransferase [Phycisphaeraceae bacterium]